MPLIPLLGDARLYSYLLLWTFIISCSSPTTSDIQFVEGPEDDNVLKGAAGYIVTEETTFLHPNKLKRELISMSLPSLKKRVIQNRQGKGGVYTLVGPDESGRIVYAQDYFFITKNKKHELRVTTLEGISDSVIFERPGDIIWENVIGKNMALSSTGGKVAFVGKHYTIDIGSSNYGTNTPFLEYGPLEVWLIETRTPVITHAKALDMGMSWFNDGNRLAYVSLLPLAEVMVAHTQQVIEGGFKGWDRVPIVMIFDIINGTSQFLHVGWNPLVSPDGKAILLSGVNKQNKIVSVETKQSRPVSWPGDWGGAISFVGDDLILYFGLPTAGTDPQWTQRNSPLVGAKPMGTLKIANLNTGKFKTVLNYVDPRSVFSFGKLDSSK